MVMSFKGRSSDSSTLKHKGYQWPRMTAPGPVNVNRSFSSFVSMGANYASRGFPVK
jgi:hypothetical protein